MLISKSRDLEKVIRTKPNFSIILIKLREILFLTVSAKIDDKKPKENQRLRDQKTYSVDSDRLEMILNSLATARYI